MQSKQSFTQPHSFITQRSQLYTDPAMLWNLSQPYMKSLIKTEAQVFDLPSRQTFGSASVAVSR